MLCTDMAHMGISRHQLLVIRVGRSALPGDYIVAMQLTSCLATLWQSISGSR